MGTMRRGVYHEMAQSCAEVASDWPMETSSSGITLAGFAGRARASRREFREMDLGDTNFFIAVLRLLLSLRHEFAVAKLAFHRYVRPLLQGRSKSGKIPPRY